MSIQKNIATTLKRTLEERGVSLMDLSKEIGIGKTSLQEYTQGKRNMRVDTLEILADKLGIPITDLVSGCSHPHLSSLHDACQTLHPLLQPVALEQLHALEKLFHLSDFLKDAEK